MTTTLSLKVLDNLLLQSISEMKLDRDLDLNPNNKLSFYSEYIKEVKNLPLIKEYFKISVGALPSLDNTKLEANNQNYDNSNYDGGAGKYTKITESQADYFLANYDILDYYGNDESGFSATVFKNKNTNEITISFRSTEYGEDFIKDAITDTEIDKNGTAIAQNISMIKYIESLKNRNIINSQTQLNVTGYSLGAHLASNFYKMYEGELNFQELTMFNGPGVGNVINPDSNDLTSPYKNLRNSLLEYDSIISFIQDLQNQDISLYQLDDFIVNNSNYTMEQKKLYKDFKTFTVGDFLEIENEQKYNLLKNTNLSKVKIGESSEEELDKQTNINNNLTSQNYYTSLLKNDFYNNFKNFIKEKYTLTSPNSKREGLDGDPIGNLVDPSFYGNLVTWIGGVGSRNANQPEPNDFNFVSFSNNYSNPIKVIIEDRVEWEGLGPRLPMEYLTFITEEFPGDFGNTHSILLLNKTLTTMKFLAEIEGKNFIDVDKYNSLISTQSPEKAMGWLISENQINNGFKTSQYGDGNSMANLINSIYKLIIPNSNNNIIFDNSLSGWSDIEKTNGLELKMNEIRNILSEKNISLEIESIYSIRPESFKNASIIDIKSASDILNIVKSNSEEGYAYRYALENMNTFVIKGVDYSNEIINYSRSDEWIKTRVELLREVTRANVGNYGDYLAENNILIDDKNLGIRFYSFDEKYNQAPNKSDLWSLNLNKPQAGTHKFTTENTFYENYTSQLHYGGRYDVIGLTSSSIFNLMINNSPILELIQYITKDNLSDINMHYTADSKNEYKSNYDIYYTSPYNSSFNSIDNNANEKIFLKPNKEYIFDFLTNMQNYQNIAPKGSYDTILIPNSSLANIETFEIMSNIDLKKGDDYIEVENDYAYISGDGGKKTYYIMNTKETLIIDPDKTGSITFNGVLLTGGQFVLDENRRRQVTIKDGITNTFTYEYKQYVLSKINSSGFNDVLVITHEETQQKIYIKDMGSFGNGTSFGFEDSEKILSNKELSFSYTDFFKAETWATKNFTINSSYDNITEFENSLKIIIPILPENMVSYQKGTSKIVYDKSNPNNIFEVENYYNIDGSLKNYSTNVVTRDSQGNIINSNVITRQPSIAGELSTSTVPRRLYVDELFRLLNTSESHDFAANDMYIISESITKKTYIEKEGNDLIFKMNGQVGQVSFTIKNYFFFNHSENTNLYIMSGATKEHIEPADLSKYFSLNLGDGDDKYIMNINDPFTKVNGGLGDDEVIGTTRNELFQSLGSHNNYNLHDGNDIFTGGGGQDIFVFSGSFGKDTITDFENDDLIYIQSLYGQNNINYKRVDNDLIIISKEFMTSELIVKDYFSKINIDNDSRIRIYQEAGTQEGLIIVPESVVNFVWSNSTTTYSEIIKQDNYIQDQNVLNPFRNISGNSSDNNITITRKGTKVTGGNPADRISKTTDGNDTIIIDIDEDEILSSVSPFRTEIGFHLKGGNDTVKNGLFKKEGEYGDIIVINNIIKYNVAYSKVFEQGSLKGVRVTLEDGSSMLIQLKGDEDPDSILLKVGSEYVKISDLDSLMFKMGSYGSDESDTVNFSTSYRGYDIKTYNGDDNITGSQGDDIIEGGKGMDIFYATSGNDTYIFNKGDGIDKFRFKNMREKLSLTFIIDNQYDTSKIKYSFDQQEKRIYLSFSQSEGVIFEDSDWPDFIFLRDGLTLKNQNGDIITIPNEVSMVTGPVFIPEEPSGPGGNPGNPGYIELNGTFGNDTINLQDNITNFVNALDGDDVIYDGTGNDFVTAGRGNDTIYLKDGLDQFNFNFGDGIDTYHLNPNATHFSITFNVSSMFSSSDMKYYYDSNNQKVYLTFSQNEGIVFENVDWQTFSSINDKIKVRYFGEMNDIAISNQVTYVTEAPFVIPDPVEILEGTNGDDVLEAQNYQLFSVVYAKDGNDSITDYRGDSVVVAGKGNDNIFMGFYTTAIFKEGDGQDMVYANYVPYNLSIMRDASRVVNGENTLFEVSLGGTADLKIKYGSDVNSSDSITIKNYFDRSVGQTFSIYEDDANKTTIYDLRSILQSLNINKQSLATMGTYNVKNSDVSGQEHLDKMVAGEIAYQYFNNSQYADKQGTANIIESMASGMLAQDKIRT